MSWQGFFIESKRYCGYDNKTLGGKARWWLAYVFSAAPRFYYYTARDAVRFAAARMRGRSGE